MRAEDFNNLEVTDQYGEKVTILEINGNTVKVVKVMNNLYHATKLFYQGKSIYDWLNETEENK